jgi:hypothetical protein
MLLFGHLGLGSALARPFRAGLERRWLLLGTILPDLIDKPLYYGLCLATGRHGAELGLISGTRTLGHTGLVLLLSAVLALVLRSRAMAAVALGMATHPLLDIGLDLVVHRNESAAVVALLFPLRGFRFAVMPLRNPLEHLGWLLDAPHVTAELIGLALLVADLLYGSATRDRAAASRSRDVRVHRAPSDTLRTSGSPWPPR